MSSAVAPSKNPLSLELRLRTREAHAAAERVFVRAAKASPGSGPELLMELNLGLVRWLDGLSAAVAHRALAREIRVFVDTVLEAHDDAPHAPAPPSPALAREAEIAGAAYAVCGSALGAAVLADAWRSETGARWVRFCAASRALERRWPLFSAALDDFADRAGPDAETEALAGATTAFDHARALVGALVASRPSLDARS